MLDIWSDLFGLAIFYGPVLSGKKRWEHADHHCRRAYVWLWPTIARCGYSAGLHLRHAALSVPPGTVSRGPLLTLFGSFDSGTVR